MEWKKLSPSKISARVFSALSKNKDYTEELVLGVPASYLDPKVFQPDDKLLADAPFLSSLVLNPNHIGCHTLNESEPFFAGTQELEREAIAICAEEILKAQEGEYDGYVAAGGTEANIQAIWVYRNVFLQDFNAKHDDIALICSEHSHYSMDKAANLLNISIHKVRVSEDFQLDAEQLDQTLLELKKQGKKYIIAVANMMTTMYGSVDAPKTYIDALKAHDFEFRLHVDGAYGGFYYPFSNEDFELNFDTPEISSVTLDAHKMVQAPYGTGILIIRKGLINYAQTEEASYVEGQDFTLSGSRSGANAVAVWMILSTYGKFGWFEKIYVLQKRTDWLCEKLDEIGIEYYRNKFSNIVTMKAEQVGKMIAEKFGLVPDDHHNPSCYKVVVMDHVEVEKLQLLVNDIAANR